MCVVGLWLGLLLVVIGDLGLTKFNFKIDDESKTLMIQLLYILLEVTFYTCVAKFYNFKKIVVCTQNKINLFDSRSFYFPLWVTTTGPYK